MRLGPITLTRRELDDFTAATLLRAYRSSDEPARSAILLSMLALSTEPDLGAWPAMRPGLDYAAHGQLVRGWLGAKGCSHKSALAAGLMAIEAVARQPGVTDEEIEEYADFFGLTLDGDGGSDSPSDTAETPSEA